MKNAHRLAEILLAIVLMVPGAASAGDLAFSVAPETVLIGSLYNGTTLDISGTAPAGCDLIVIITGVNGEANLREKGRALGLLWMNRDSLTFAAVPSLFLVTASKPLDQLGAAAQPFTLEGIQDRFQVEPPAADTPQTRAEFVRLKVSEGRYRQDPAPVVLGPAQADSQPFHAQIRLPSRLAPGTYEVEAVALHDGQIASRKQKSVTAQLIGVPALLAQLAFRQAALYGVVATVIAILAGLGIGLVFQSKGAH